MEMSRDLIRKVVLVILLSIFLVYNYYLSSLSNLNDFSNWVLSSDNFITKILEEISTTIGFQNDTPKPKDIIGRFVRFTNIGFNIAFAFLLTKKATYERKILVGGFLIAIIAAVVLLLMKKLTGNMVFHEQGGRISQVISAPFLFLLMFPFMSLIKQLSSSKTKK